MSTVTEFFEDMDREQSEPAAFMQDFIRDAGMHPIVANDLTRSRNAFSDEAAKARLRIKHEIHGALTAPSPQVGRLTMCDVLFLNCLHKSKGVSLEELALRFGLPVAEIERVVTRKLRRRRWTHNKKGTLKQPAGD